MLRNEVDRQQMREQLLMVVQETIQPAHVSLWLRQPERNAIAPTHRLEPHAEGPGKPSPD